MKKVLMILVLAALVAGGAFAQRVGGTYTLDGQQYEVVRVDGNDVLLRKVLSLDGAWANDDGSVVFTFSGANGVYTVFNLSDSTWRDAINKGMFKVGDQGFRNLRKSGDLTWTGQRQSVQFNRSAPDVATGMTWSNITLTMSADGRTLSFDGGRTVALTRR